MSPKQHPVPSAPIESDEAEQAERGEAEIEVPPNFGDNDAGVRRPSDPLVIVSPTFTASTSNSTSPPPTTAEEDEFVVPPTVSPSGSAAFASASASSPAVVKPVNPFDTATDVNGDEEAGGSAAAAAGGGGRDFPEAFYCPLTKKVMQDPVVHPSGDSYERSAAIDKEAKSKTALDTVNFYPNRALKAYIDSVMERVEAEGTVLGTIHKIDTSLRNGWDKIVDKTGLPLEESRPLPDEFYCTLTLDLCHEPVIDPDGYTYEREAIVHWVQHNGDSPVTRKPLSIDQLYDNNAVLNILLEESAKPEDEIQPCIRRWREDMDNPTPTSIVPVSADGDNNEHSIRIVINGELPEMPGAEHGQRYPASREELDERMRQQSRLSMISLMMIIVVISFALVYMPFYLVLFCLAFCSCMYARRRFQERQRYLEGR